MVFVGCSMLLFVGRVLFAVQVFAVCCVLCVLVGVCCCVFFVVCCLLVGRLMFVSS